MDSYNLEHLSPCHIVKCVLLPNKASSVVAWMTPSSRTFLIRATHALDSGCVRW